MFYPVSIGTVISFLFMFITTLFSIYLMYIYFRTDTNRKISENRKKLFEQYINILENNYQDINDFMNNYNSLIYELNECFNRKEYNRLNEIISMKVLPFKYDLSKETVLLERLSYIKSNELKSILYTKLVQCKGQNLNVVLDVPQIISKINVKSIDLIKILGIFIDNAIESAFNTNEKIIIIGFYKGHHRDYVINIKNSFNNVDVNKIYDMGYSTKKISDDRSRGIGLNEVKQIVHKYANLVLETKIDSSMNLFVQELYIF